jgi:hypothetical protein
MPRAFDTRSAPTRASPRVPGRRLPYPAGLPASLQGHRLLDLAWLPTAPGTHRPGSAWCLHSPPAPEGKLRRVSRTPLSRQERRPPAEEITRGLRLQPPAERMVSRCHRRAAVWIRRFPGGPGAWLNRSSGMSISREEAAAVVTTSLDVRRTFV